MTWTQPAFETVANLVSRRTGLSFGNRADSVEAGIRRAMARAQLSDFGGYVALIAMDESAFEDLVNELTIGETYFFREPAHFRLIQNVIVPDIRQRRGSQHAPRAWSSACASGEEPYSLAILFEQAGLETQAQVMATDISTTALAKARRANYDAWSLRGDNAEAAKPYLVPSGKRFQLDEKIRRRVTFTQLNLALDAYPSFANGIWGMDLILCRNVLIYLDRETIRLVARRLYETLVEGGWLITASADPPLWEHAPFQVVNIDEGLFYRRFDEHDKVTSWQRDKVTEEVALAPPIEELEIQPVAEPVPGPVPSFPCSPAPLSAAEAAVLQVRALANRETADAERACVEALALHPFCAELHYLHAVLWLALGHTEEAIQAVRRVLYLDRTLAIAHFTLGSILRDRGDQAGACRAFRNTRDLCAARPADEVVSLTDGEPAGRLAEIAGKELAFLEAARGKP